MPVVCIRFNNGVVVAEKKDNNYYDDVVSKVNEMGKMATVNKGNPLTRNDCQDLLKSTTSTSEVQRIKHVISSTHNLSKRQAERLGIRDLRKRAIQVENATETVKNIRSKHRYFAKVEQKAFLDSKGISYQEYLSSDSDSSESDSESDDVVAVEVDSNVQALLPIQETQVESETEQGETQVMQTEPITTHQRTMSTPTDEHPPEEQDRNGPHKSIPDLDVNSVLVLDILKETDFNWFAFVAYLEPKFLSQGYTQEVFDQFLSDFGSQLHNLGLNDEQYRLAEQSRVVYLSEMQEKEIRAETIEEGEDENDLTSSETVGNIDSEAIQRKLRQIKGKARKKARAEIEGSGLFQRKSVHRMDAIEKRHPDIGEVMEKIVTEADVGADKWRRTGVYTFSGDTKKEKRITFKSLAEKLSDHYGEKISYGTVVQLCVPRNKLRQSSKRYKGVANIKYQKPRKGFDLKFNPDMKWSRSFYKCLDKLQNDGRHILLLNRDDQAGFRLDSTYTHKSIPSFNVGSPTVTTHTDFLNKHQAQLQTTSYNFSSTSTTSEVCCGVVKASVVHEKSPSQHASDLMMLEKIPELAPVFQKKGGDVKDIECIRVDGGSDEGPSHTEVQFLWTERHYSRPTKVTLVTTRSRGDSFLNRVELQNGCLARGHSNLFIPSTLCGVPYNEAGEYDESKHRENMEASLTQYIERVDQTPCMRTTISLYRGVTDHEILKRRWQLLVFLRGNTKEKEKLKKEDPELYQYFKTVWTIRQNHVDDSLPINYVFLLRCCGKTDCPHPLCSGK